MLTWYLGTQYVILHTSALASLTVRDLQQKQQPAVARNWSDAVAEMQSRLKDEKDHVKIRVKSVFAINSSASSRICYRSLETMVETKMPHRDLKLL